MRMFFGWNRAYILTDLNHTELFKHRMTVTSNTNMSHLVTEESSEVLSLPIVIIHKQIPDKFLLIAPLESFRVDEEASMVFEFSD